METLEELKRRLAKKQKEAANLKAKIKKREAEEKKKMDDAIVKAFRSSMKTLSIPAPASSDEMSVFMDEVMRKYLLGPANEAPTAPARRPDD